MDQHDHHREPSTSTITVGPSPKVEQPTPPAVKNDPPPAKPQKTLSRVPRACNACRRQKMKCDLEADKPPCKRCKHANIECLFEKPQRDSALSTDVGLERIRGVEDRVRTVEEKVTSLQTGVNNIQATLQEVLSVLRQAPSAQAPQPSTPSYDNQSPDQERRSFPDARRVSGVSMPAYPHHARENGSAASATSSYDPQIGHSATEINSSAFSHAASAGPPFGRYPILPPISPHPNTSMPPPRLPSLPPIRTHPDYQSGIRGTLTPNYPHRPGSSRAIPSSNVTSADSSDDEGLPASGLVAPLEVLRVLGAEQESAEQGSPSRRRSPSPSYGEQERPRKRRKTSHSKPKHDFPDVVTKGIVSEHEARELFNIFYKGCSTFLPVFDSIVDTFESLHQHSPLAVNAICMVASQVRDGGGPTSHVTQACRDEVHLICAQSLFAPVSSQGAVRAVVLLSGWSNNGWLTCGHAVRMAMEMEMHKAWPKLLKRINAGKMSTSAEDQRLVVAARTWFCLYLFEHQMSFGTGRPAILKEDESVLGGVALMQHPLSIEDDARLVSTVELMIYRERANNMLSPTDRPFTDERYARLMDACESFRQWYTTWDKIFSQRYPDTTFYRQSLQIQQLFAELFHDATLLRGTANPEDVARMPPGQRSIAVQAMRCAKQGLGICLRSSSYREGLKYAVHYTHVTATFAASFIMRLMRLFPEEAESLGGVESILADVEALADLLSTIPATRYARTLRLMLASRKKRVQMEELQQNTPVIRDLPNGHALPEPAQRKPSYPEPAMQQPVNYAPQQHVYSVPQAQAQPQPIHVASPTTEGHGAYVQRQSNIGPPRQFLPILNGTQPVMMTPVHAVPPGGPMEMTGMVDMQQGFDGQAWLEGNIGDTQFGLESFILPAHYPVPTIW